MSKCDFCNYRNIDCKNKKCEDETVDYKTLLPFIIIDNKLHQILLNDNERKKVFNVISNLRGKIELDKNIFCEVKGENINE